MVGRRRYWRFDSGLGEGTHWRWFLPGAFRAITLVASRLRLNRSGRRGFASGISVGSWFGGNWLRRRWQGHNGEEIVGAEANLSTRYRLELLGSSILCYIFNQGDLRREQGGVSYQVDQESARARVHAAFLAGWLHRLNLKGEAS
jgi:hypothetical protein